MATLTLSQLILPTFTKGLKTLDHILTRAEQHAASKGLDPDAEYPDTRLIDDMNPLTFQVQTTTKAVRVTLSRCLGQDLEAWRDEEKTIADLHKRVGLALMLLEGVDAKTIDDQAGEVIELPFAGLTLRLAARDAALNHGLPNFFFHISTAYAILRSKGVPIGKADYLGGFLAH
ncbi:hypothetical protein GE09DRAFT_1165348 [Coniochaeta sp. 2T2.1]|nr:hypothetical protein GE09DRAFT_1165348 [Coniochaeta sp. 2T2.1]